MTDAPLDSNLPAPLTTDDEGLSIYGVFETDTSAEEEGRWFNLAGYERPGELEIKLRGFRCKTSTNVNRRLQSLYRRHAAADGSYPIDVIQKIMQQQLADCNIVDWRGKGWRRKDGSPLVYSRDAALQLVTDIPAFRDKCASLCSDLDAFRIAEQDAAVKN